MKLSKVLCLFLMLTLVLSFASCKLFVKHTVEFDSDGGSPVKTQEVRHGDPAKEPSVPYKDGYFFLGWFSGDEKWNFETPVNADLKLVAHWEKQCDHEDADDNNQCDNCGTAYQDGTDLPEAYTIVYMDGVTKLFLQPSSYNSESGEITLPTPNTKTFFDFVGWYSDPDFTQSVTEIDVNGNKNIVLYAKFVPTNYTVTYVLDDGVNSSENPATYTYETLITELADPTKDGYKFKGWYTDANCTEKFDGVTLGTIGNITVYAKWEKNPPAFVVTFLDHEGNLISEDTFYMSEDSQVIKKKHELAGYTFLGWLDAEGNKVTSIPAGNTDNLTLTANMQKNITSRQVTYYIDGIVAFTENFDVLEGLDALMSGEQGGYDFFGWYADPEYAGEAVTSVPAETYEDINLYGYRVAKTYTVKYFDKDGNELSYAPASYQISATDTALPLAPMLDGHIVLGWYNENGEKLTAIPANTYGDLNLYAKYEAAKYTVTYVLNGGWNDDRNVTEYAHGALPTLHNPENREGYLFAGWFTDPTFAPAYAVETFNDCANRDVTLFAKWIPVSQDNNSSTMTPEVPF